MNPKTLLVLVLLSQTATALNYTNLPELNLTIGTPPYGTVWNYNMDRSLTATEPPAGVNLSDGPGVRDAWIKILALDKLILDSETNNSYASRQGQVLVGYNFTPQCPPGEEYCWPSCVGTRYELASYDSEYGLYANGVLQGNGQLQDYSISENSSMLELEARLATVVRCRKYHLHWVLDENNQPEYCTEEYDGIRTFKAAFEDKATYGLTELKPQANLSFSRLAQDVSGTSKGRLSIRTASPYSDARFTIGDNKLEFSGNAYDIDYYLPDYNLLRISTYSLPRITDYGLFSELSRNRSQTDGITTVLDFTLTYAETQAMLESRDCKLVIKDLFNKECVLDKLCETEWKQTTLNASTSGLLFNDGEQVNVSAVLAFNGIPLEGRKLILRYAGVEYEEYTNSEGIASFTIKVEYPENKIEVEYSGESEYLGSSKTLLIASSNSRAMTLVTGILPAVLLLLVTAYGFYRMVKWRGW